MDGIPSKLKAAKFRKQRHARLLFFVIGLEAVAIIALLLWVVALRPAKTPLITPAKPTPAPIAAAVPKIAINKYATGLTQPTGIVAMPGAADKRLFVVQQTGQIKIVLADKSIDPTPFLDISSKIMVGGEMGLLGLVFHPHVATNGYFYINYIDKQQNTIIARYTIDKKTGRADPKSEAVLIKQKQPYPNHKGGSLAFGPDGYLYIGLGDGGSAGDPDNRAQDTNQLLGKILRIDVDNGNPYATPATNPISKGDGRQEIWAYGLRNPWRFSFDRQTGDLYIADVGQDKYEEIDFQKAGSSGGQNYGWRCTEGDHPYNTSNCQQTGTTVAPVVEYDHADKRCSVTGGYVYRGSNFPHMVGKYFYADYCSGQIFYTTSGGSSSAPVLATTTTAAISTFGQDSSGELYLADYATGTIYHLEDIAE